MTMHLAHPSITLNGKRKGKQKFKSAEAARKARELDESWKELQKRWGVEEHERKRKRAMTAEVYQAPKPSYRGAQDPKIPSLNTGEAGVSTAKQTKVYTGTKVKGIGTMHKSNAVPIFSDEEAVAISSMRR
jgi:hypothetical protein